MKCKRRRRDLHEPFSANSYDSAEARAPRTRNNRRSGGLYGRQRPPFWPHTTTRVRRRNILNLQVFAQRIRVRSSVVDSLYPWRENPKTDSKPTNPELAIRAETIPNGHTRKRFVGSQSCAVNNKNGITGIEYLAKCVTTVSEL